jgi:hypothetical protein
MVHFPGVERPPPEQKLKRAKYDADAWVACLNATGKAANLNAQGDRIQRILHYKRTYDDVLRAHRRHKRENRKGVMSKIMAAVVLGATGGTMKAYTSFRHMERENSGDVSATANRTEVSDGKKIIWKNCEKDLKLYITREGFRVSLRRVAEMEILNYEQGLPSAVRDPNKKRGASAVPLATHDAARRITMLDCVSKAVGNIYKFITGRRREQQQRYTLKFSFDARGVSRRNQHTEGMLLLIPVGDEGQTYCQSAIRIRSIVLYNGKDSKDGVRANLTEVLKEIKELEEHGIRYTASKGTFLGQVGPKGEKEPLQEGDRDVKVEFQMPADMAAHVGLFGHGGLHDKNKHFCTHCKCAVTERHTPFSLVRVPEATTVGEISGKYGMHVSTFWAINAGGDPEGMFPGAELTEAALAHKTVTLAQEPPPPHTSAVPPGAAAPAGGWDEGEVPLPATGRAANQGVVGRGGKKTRGGRGGRGGGGRKPLAVAGARVPVGATESPVLAAAECSFFRNRSGLFMSAEQCGKRAVPAGTLIRIVTMHILDRKSDFLEEVVGLAQERWVLSISRVPIPPPSSP